MNLLNAKPNNLSLDKLIVDLGKKDKQYSTVCRVLKYLYWCLIPLYAILAVVSAFETGEYHHLVSGACYVIGLGIFAYFLGKFQKEYKNVDYSLPTLSMLKEAAYRWQPFQLRMIWVFIGVLFIDAGISITSYPDFSSLIEKQIFLLIVVCISVPIGLLIWYFRHKPLRDNALKLIAEIEND